MADLALRGRVLRPITGQDAAAAISDALRFLVGPKGRLFTVEALAAETDIEARTLASYLAGDSGHYFAKVLTLMAYLGPQFTNPVINVAGQGGAYRLAPMAVKEPSAMLADMAARLHALAEALADFTVDHREAAMLRELFREAEADIPVFTRWLDAVAAGQGTEFGGA